MYSYMYIYTVLQVFKHMVQVHEVSVERQVVRDWQSQSHTWQWLAFHSTWLAFHSTWLAFHGTWLAFHGTGISLRGSAS